MTSAFTLFHFIRPLWLFGLIPVFGLYFYLRNSLIHNNPWAAVCDAHLWPYLFPDSQTERSSQKNKWRMILLAWIMTIIALAGPAWSRVPSSIHQSLTGRIIVLDLSSAMMRSDLLPSRYERAKFKIIDILKRPYQGQTGLIVYSGRAYAVSPLTSDTETIIALLPELNPSIMPKKGYDVVDALNKAIALFHQAGLNRGEILLVSANPWSEAEASANKNNVISSAQQLHQQGFTLSVLGVGVPPVEVAINSSQPTSASLDVTSLQLLAKAGGGHYVTFSNDDSDLDNLLNPTNSISTSLLHTFSSPLKQSELTNKTNSDSSETYPVEWQDRGPWFIFLVLIIVLFGFRRGWIERWF